MLELKKEIKKIGNGNYINIPATFLKEGLLKKGVKYKISIEEDKEEQFKQTEPKKNLINMETCFIQ